MNQPIEQGKRKMGTPSESQDDAELWDDELAEQQVDDFVNHIMYTLKCENTGEIPDEMLAYYIEGWLISKTEPDPTKRFKAIVEQFRAFAAESIPQIEEMFRNARPDDDSSHEEQALFENWKNHILLGELSND